MFVSHALILVAVVLGSCSNRQPSTPQSTLPAGLGPNQLAAAHLGGPIPGLTDAEAAAFLRGKVLFEKRFQPSEGLGPLYNATSCASCHSTPVTGGSGQLYRNFYLAMWGTAPFMAGFPELPSPVVPAFGQAVPGGSRTFTLQVGRHVMRANYYGAPVVVAQRNAIPVLGTGLFEFVSNATILANADPYDLDGNGISGRPNYDFGDMGRFGVKAQANNIERFTRPPLNNQMGITSDPFLGAGGTITLSSTAPQATGNPNSPIIDNDSVPDPEMSRNDLGDLIAFTRFLAPPQRRPFSPLAVQGEALFDTIRCSECHITSLASTRGPVEAHTDLLLHDMGPGLADGMQFGAPAPGPLSTASEFRTQPLWGVSLHAPFLHDGRAATLTEAITAHGGEAQASRDLFVALSAADQLALISFLEHL